jgi:hypothetical protein
MYLMYVVFRLQPTNLCPPGSRVQLAIIVQKRDAIINTRQFKFGVEDD